MPITITPTVADISLGVDTLTNSDWEQDTPATLSLLVNHLGTMVQALGATTGTVVIAITGNYSLSGPQAANINFVFTGVLGADAIITFPAGGRAGTIVNNTTGGFDLLVGLAGGSVITVPFGGSAAFSSDGDDVVLANGMARDATGAVIPGTLTVTGATILSSTLAVTGAVTMASTAAITGDLDVTGGAVIHAALQVLGDVTLQGNATVSGTLDATGPISSGGGGDFSGDVTVDGAITSTSTISAATAIYVRSPSLSTDLVIDSPAGLQSTLFFQSDGLSRWYIGKTADTEDGFDTGSNVLFVRFDDLGTAYRVMQFNRDSGAIILYIPDHPVGPAGSLWGDVDGFVRFVQ